MVTSSESCGRCKATLVPRIGSCATGYGYSNLYPAYGKICYACCGELDKDQMARDGRAALYLTSGIDAKGNRYWFVMNWPGTLRFPAEVTISKPVWVFGQKLCRHTARFKGPDGFWWSGWNYNHNSECISVRRTKKKVDP